MVDGGRWVAIKKLGSEQLVLSSISSIAQHVASE